MKCIASWNQEFQRFLQEIGALHRTGIRYEHWMQGLIEVEFRIASAAMRAQCLTASTPITLCGYGIFHHIHTRNRLWLDKAKFEVPVQQITGNG